ncbi:unnamed protein product [Rotaria socialis]|uniref:RNase H type-1 domain-containing protein n=1 Tax=Rotaria socialis TaxID=392032 RepID=A0A821W4S5_9BILA|nr:unnamed protein product [Rotaria socialis]CAF4919554.1 unnamed protein product [Rotaria socialis]
MNHIQEHTGEVQIYTDGSKSSSGVGYASVLPGVTKSGPLPETASIFTAEMVAIVTALRAISSHPQQSFVIFCDSLSVLQSIESYESNNPLVQHIQQWLFFISARRKELSFCWVPGHIGVAGNERADGAAKDASRLEAPQRALPHSDYMASYYTTFLQHWQDTWEKKENNKLRIIKKDVRPWHNPNLPSRRQEIALARLRMGHTRLTHGYLMESGAPPYCMSCIVPMTVEHFLVECPDYSDERKLCFGKIMTTSSPLTISRVLGENDIFDHSLIMQFLNLTGLLSKI